MDWKQQRDLEHELLIGRANAPTSKTWQQQLPIEIKDSWEP